MSRASANRHRALRVLGGEYLPQVGHTGILAETSRSRERKVVVARVSDSGKTIWLRFLSGPGDNLESVSWHSLSGDSKYSFWVPMPRLAWPGGCVLLPKGDLR